MNLGEEMNTHDIELPAEFRSAKITERSQKYLDDNLDADEHEAFINWAREAHDYPEYALLILDSEWCQGAVAGWQGAIEADRLKREDFINDDRDSLRAEIVALKGTISDMESDRQQCGEPSDEDIRRIARELYLSGDLIWMGFDRDEHGEYTQPTITSMDITLFRALLARYGQPVFGEEK